MRLTFGLLALVTTLGIGYANMAGAQTPRETPAQTTDVREDGDDGVDLGWIGLLGLAGLLGMKRSDSRVRSDATMSSSTR